MTAITHIHTVIVPVDDQDAALEFYVSTLGFEVRVDGEFAPGQRWLEVAPPGAQTSLALVRPEQANGVRANFATENAAADHTALLHAGVDADADLIELGEYVPPMFGFRAPDGTGFRVVETG